VEVNPLPDIRHDLYTKVLKRVLTAPVTGLGMWTDDLPIDHRRLSEVGEDALDRVVAIERDLEP
jgi:hypothetical protein